MLIYLFLMLMENIKMHLKLLILMMVDNQLIYNHNHIYLLSKNNYKVLHTVSTAKGVFTQGRDMGVIRKAYGQAQTVT